MIEINYMNSHIRKYLVAIAMGVFFFFSTQSFALVSYGDSELCTTEAKDEELQAAVEAYEQRKIANEEETRALSNLKRDLSCLDVLMNTDYSIALPSLSSIMAAIQKQITDLVCSQANKVVDEVTGQVNETVNFPGIEGIPGTGARGDIYVGRGNGRNNGNITIGGERVEVPLQPLQEAPKEDDGGGFLERLRKAF